MKLNVHWENFDFWVGIFSNEYWYCHNFTFFLKFTEKAPSYVYIQLMSKYDKKFQKSPTHTNQSPINPPIGGDFSTNLKSLKKFELFWLGQDFFNF